MYNEKEKKLMNQNDKRVIHTKRILRQTLLELMNKKPINKITVKELCENADINRNTFYAHYGAPEDIIAEIENEYYDTLRAFQDSAINNGDDIALIYGIMQTLLEHKDFCTVLYGSNSAPAIKDRIYKDAFSRIMFTWIETGKVTQPDHLRWLFFFLSGGIDAIIRAWVQGGMKESPRDLATLVGNMCHASAGTVFGNIQINR